MTSPTSAVTIPSLSNRVQALKPSATFAVNARVKSLRAEGRDVIGFGAGEPDFDTPSFIKDAAIDALRRGETGYQPVPGPEPARRAVAERLQRVNGIDCSASDIVITVGGKSGVYFALQAVVNPGSEVILPTPAWVSYRPMIELAGGTVVELAGGVERDFRITPEQLDAAITPRTCALLLNSPSNPCGTMYTPTELMEFAEILRGHESIWILSDEIYDQLVYGGVDHFSLGSVDFLRERVLTLNGLSKAYAMTGWRLGYVCAPGGGGAVAKAIARLQAQVTSHPTSFLFPAIEAALRDGADDMERMRVEFSERAERIYGHLSAIDGLVCPKPTGAFYVFPNIGAFLGRTSPGGRVLDSALSFAEALLEEALVAVVPGEDFGACGHDHIRMSFACSVEQIDAGCQRLAKWLDDFGT